MQQNVEGRVEKYLVLALAGIVLGSSILSAVAHKVLAADGAFYVLQMVNTQDFFLVGWHRHHAQYLTQFLPVLATRLFGADVEVVEFLYSLSICMVFVASIGLSLRSTRGMPLAFGVYAISILAIGIFSDFIFMGEHQVLLLLSWPILLFALNPSGSRLERTGIVVCAIVVARCYEASTVVLGLPLLITAYRSFRAWRCSSRDFYYWLGLGVVLLAGIMIGAHGILNPRDAGNMTGFASTAMIPLSAPTTMAVIAFLVAYGAAVFLGGGLLVFGTFVVGGAGLVLAWSIGGSPDSWQSFSGRNMTVTLLPALMFLCVIMRVQCVTAKVNLLAVITTFAAGLALVFGLGQFRWIDLQTQIRDQTQATRGFIAYEAIDLPKELLFPYWTLPTLSILLQPECVRSIVLPPADYPWQPFDPRVDRPLPLQRQFDESVGGSGC